MIIHHQINGRPVTTKHLEGRHSHLIQVHYHDDNSDVWLKKAGGQKVVGRPATVTHIDENHTPTTPDKAALTKVYFHDDHTTHYLKKKTKRLTHPLDGTSNERIRDALLKRRIDIAKYADGVSHQMNQIIDDTEPAVRAEIEKTLDTLRLPNGVYLPFGPETNAHIKQLGDRIYAIRSAAIMKAFALVADDLAKLGPAEAQFLDDLVNSVSPVKLETKMPSHAKLAALGKDTPIL